MCLKKIVSEWWICLVGTLENVRWSHQYLKRTELHVFKIIDEDKKWQQFPKQQAADYKINTHK